MKITPGDVWISACANKKCRFWTAPLENHPLPRILLRSSTSTSPPYPLAPHFALNFLGDKPAHLGLGRHGESAAGSLVEACGKQLQWFFLNRKIRFFSGPGKWRGQVQRASAAGGAVIRGGRSTRDYCAVGRSNTEQTWACSPLILSLGFQINSQFA